MNDRISDTLQKASAIVNTPDSAPAELADEPEEDNDVTSNEDGETSKGIVTTVEEVEGYEMVKTLVADVVDPERIYIRDTQSYCGILLDNNNRRAICRLYFNQPHRKFIRIYDGGGEHGRLSDTHFPIETVEDIAECGEELRKAVIMRLQESA